MVHLLHEMFREYEASRTEHHVLTLRYSKRVRLICLPPSEIIFDIVSPEGSVHVGIPFIHALQLGKGPRFLHVRVLMISRSFAYDIGSEHGSILLLKYPPCLHPEAVSVKLYIVMHHDYGLSLHLAPYEAVGSVHGRGITEVSSGIYVSDRRI